MYFHRKLGVAVLAAMATVCGVAYVQGFTYYSCSVGDQGPYTLQGGCGGSADMMIYMNDNGPTYTGSMEHSYTVQYGNGGPAHVNDAVITIYGPIYSSGFMIASGLNYPTFSGIVEGQYAQWTSTIPSGGTGDFAFFIAHPADGVYVYTASISSIDTTDSNTGDSTFTVHTTVDTLTQAPTILAPVSGLQFANDTGMTISFVLPESLQSHSLSLSFIPQDLSGQVPVFQLMDANYGVPNIFSLIPNNPYASAEIVSGNTASIPNGTYTVVLGYKDAFANPLASTSVQDIEIIDRPAPFVLTEVTPVAPVITSSSVRYSFYVAGLTGIQGETVVSDCGWGSDILAEEVRINSGMSIEIGNLQAGKTYECEVNVRSVAGGVESNRLHIGPFTFARAGGGGGGGGGAAPDYCPNGDMSSSFYDDSCGNVVETWKTFFATLGSGAVSTVSDPITVKAFVTDVFTLLHISKPIHRQADSDTKTVSDKLVIKVISILKKLLTK